jgi:hypothetical protein
MALVIGGGINIGGSISIGPAAIPPLYPALVMNLDAASYSGSGPWIDSVNSLSFTLNNSPTYSASVGGGSFTFATGSSQYAECSTSLGNLTNWSVEAWHYYDGTNTGASPCIITEIFPSITNEINYILGNGSDTSPDLQTGMFYNGWVLTENGYTLTASNWYQIVGTYDGVTLKLYVNNSLVQTTYTNSPSVSGGSGIRLMRRWDNDEYWGGKLGIVRIYDGDIGASGVTTNWNANKARFGL